MSILIKGLKMPKDGCKDCPIVKRGLFHDICPYLKREVDGNVERGGKPYDCPIIELSDHGDLVDMDYIKRHWPNVQHFGAPVVIPAERSE